MKKMKLIRQRDEKDCGAACLSMVLEYYGRKASFSSVRQAIKVDKNGANIYGIIDGAKKFHLSSEAYEGSSEDAWDTLSKSEYTLPIMIRILNDERYEHYVVVSGITSKYIIVFDPAKGKRKLKKEEFDKVFLGHVITFQPDGDFKSANDRRPDYGRYFHIIGKQKRLLFVTLLISLAITAIGMSGMYLFRYIIDSVVPYLTSEEMVEESIETLCILIFAIGTLYVIRFFLVFVRSKIMAFISKNVDIPIILGFYDHVTELPLSFLETFRTGEIISRFEDAGKIRDAISGSVIAVTLDSLLVVVCGYALFLQSQTLFPIAFIIFLAYLFVAVIYINPLQKANQDVMYKNAEFTSILKESIDGIETIKSTRSEDVFRKHTAEVYHSLVEKGIKNGLLNVRKESLINLITSMGTLSVLWSGTVQILEGNITVGTLVTFVSLMSCFLDPIQSLVELQGNIQTAVVAADRLNDILTIEKEKTTGKEFNGPVQKIEFHNVDFRYGNRELVLKDISFEITKGNRVAMIGESGCGKSTAVKLIMGLHEPEKGIIKINGTDIAEVSADYLRKQIAYVPQSTFLFSDSIYNNLLLGAHRKDITKEEIEKVLDICQCQFIRNLPLGIDSELEENGTNLSGGQKQRIAIARALLGDPSVLILDESTSALDAMSERRLLDGIREEYPSMTMIIVTHRIRSISDCDRICLLENGSIVANGAHQGLLDGNMLYADLWNAQEEYRRAAS